MSTLVTVGAVITVVGALMLLSGALLKSAGSMAGSFALWGPGLFLTLLAAVGNQWLPVIIGLASVTVAASSALVVASSPRDDR